LKTIDPEYYFYNRSIAINKNEIGFEEIKNDYFNNIDTKWLRVFDCGSDIFIRGEYEN